MRLQSKRKALPSSHALLPASHHPPWLCSQAPRHFVCLIHLFVHSFYMPGSKLNRDELAVNFALNGFTSEWEG